MLTAFLKFFHVLIALSLIGLTGYSIGNSKHAQNLALLVLCLLAIITGTFLVIPKGYHFHTDWIRAAYFLGLLFCGGILMVWNRGKWVRAGAFIFLFAVLIIITHDAVTKSTFLPPL